MNEKPSSKSVAEAFNKVHSAIHTVEKGNIVNVYNWQEMLKKRTVIAFGLGKFFHDTHERLFKMCRIDYLCDNDSEYWGKELFGKICISIEELCRLEDAFVIAVVGNYEPIRIQMEALGIESMHISEMHFEHYVLGTSLTWMKDALSDIKYVMGSLQDEKSLQVFTEVMCRKLGAKLSDNTYGEIATDGEYFEQGIWKLNDSECFVDVGAYTGDTVEDFVSKTKGKFEKIYTLELIKENAIKLQRAINQYEDGIRSRITVMNAGAWNKEERLLCGGYGDSDGFGVVDADQFTGKGEFCRLAALDDLIPKEPKITILKMDIEGAEEKALEGAKRILSEDCPKLAICLYHRPDDFWKLPLKILEINPEYKIYFRHHSYVNYTDTVLYAKI